MMIAAAKAELDLARFLDELDFTETQDLKASDLSVAYLGAKDYVHDKDDMTWSNRDYNRPTPYRLS